MITILFCSLYKAPLFDRPNRPGMVSRYLAPILMKSPVIGYMAIAQLPFVFLFATKNSILSLLWHKGYEKLNFLHRWAGRSMFLLAILHGSFWLRNHLRSGTSIMTQEKDRLGVMSFIVLGILVLSSVKTGQNACVRRVLWNPVSVTQFHCVF